MHFLYKFKADSQIPLPPFSCPALSSRTTISSIKYAKRSPCDVDSHLRCVRVSLLSFMVEVTVKDNRCASYFKQRLADLVANPIDLAEIVDSVIARKRNEK